MRRSLGPSSPRLRLHVRHRCDACRTQRTQAGDCRALSVACKSPPRASLGPAAHRPGTLGTGPRPLWGAGHPGMTTGRSGSPWGRLCLAASPEPVSQVDGHPPHRAECLCGDRGPGGCAPPQCVHLGVKPPVPSPLVAAMRAWPRGAAPRQQGPGAGPPAPHWL